jgi:mRNA interferase MazF
MVIPSVGAVVLLPFPFSDLSSSKLRPAVVLAEAGRGDWILSQVTSNPYGDALAIALSEADFQEGSLRIKSFVRPGKLFTANHELFVSQAGTLTPESFQRIIESVVTILRSGLPPPESR